ncbi:MAG TPA: FecR domain-containing protein [Stellaceae bacterium]|jgi:hypothetical protein|nr:FecR domain-containing protein [Stellaceae bacterium]
MPGFAPLALRIALAAVFAGLSLVASTGSLFAQDKVGVNSAVNPQANGTPPGGSMRQLVIGQEVVYNERITTGPAGQTQMLFLDESSMTIGPNSDLKIDQFVYDPKSGTGKLAMSATRGLLRYVGGKLSKQNDAVTLQTSTATLAVRGGAFIVNISPNGTTNAIFIYGSALTITGANGASTTISRPGYESTTVPGGSPSPPSPEPPGQLASYLQQLDGRPGGSGGAPTIPTDTTVANSGISQTISGDINQSVRQSLQSQGGTNNNNSSSGNSNASNAQTNNNPQPNSAGQIISCIAGSTCDPSKTVQVGKTTSGQPVGGNQSSSGNGGGGTTPTPPTTITVAGRLKNTNGGGTIRGFVDQSSLGDIPYSSGTLSFPSGTTQAGTFTGTFGSLGTISFPLAPGSASFGPTGTSSSLGSFSGTSFLSADNTYFYASITPTNQPTERLFVFGGTPVNSSFYQQTGTTRIFSFSVQPDAALQSNIPFVRSQAGGNIPNASVSPLYVVAPPTTPIGQASTIAAARTLQASLAINGQGANQQSVVAVTTGTVGTSASGQPMLLGALRGSSQMTSSGAPVRISSAVSSTVDGNGNSFYGANAISGFVLDQTNFAKGPAVGTAGAAINPSTAAELPLSSGATTYGFTQPVQPQAVPNNVGASRTSQALSGNFGGLMYTTAQATPYIVTGPTIVSTDAPNNRVQATFAGTAQSPSSGVSNVTMQYGGLTGDVQGRTAFVDNSHFAALESVTAPQQINGQNLQVNGDTTQAGKLYMLSSGTVAQPTQLLPPGASFCQCQYLQWGYWGGDLQTGNASNASVSRIDRGGINTWVAGVPTPLNDLNTLQAQSATASYSGAAIGSVFNNGTSYVAAGGFNGTYNFGTQSGQVAISNFDGKSFAASGRAPLTGTNYNFTVASPGIKGAINGAFYGPMAAETGGSFAIQSTIGPAYLASGTYAGKR